MKHFFYLILPLFCVYTLLPMQSSGSGKKVTLQVGTDEPLTIPLNIFEQCGICKAALHVNPAKKIHTFSSLKLLDQQQLQIKDVLTIVKILQNQTYIKNITSKEIGHVFFTADFMMVSQKIMFALANRYKDLVGLENLEQLTQRTKQKIFHYLKSIKSVLHKVKNDGSSYIFLLNNGLMFVHDIALLSSKLNLKNITDLNLSRNQLAESHLNDICLVCPNIQSIDLSHNQIKKITKKEVQALSPALVVLDLRHNRIVQFVVPCMRFKNGYLSVHLQENYLSKDEVQKIKQLTNEKKNTGLMGLIAVLFFCSQCLITGDILTEGPPSWLLLQALAMLSGFFDLADTIYRELKVEKVLVVTGHQRQLE